MLEKSLCFLWVAMVFCSCNEKLVYVEYQATKNARWQSEEPMEFMFSELDTIAPHNMFINVRNDNTFPFSNLFLIAELEEPSGATIRDTLEFEMAAPDGNWLGSGFGSIKENKLWYRENIVFRDSGVYRVRVSHAMRANGNIAGIELLEGITDVGLQIEKNYQ
ncbi:MAG: gliding motility lipoprotein GldH [Bacteroidota bacterium]